jgi:hypothetical protein
MIVTRQRQTSKVSTNVLIMNRKRDSDGFDGLEDTYVHKVVYEDGNSDGHTAVVTTDDEGGCCGKWQEYTGSQLLLWRRLLSVGSLSFPRRQSRTYGNYAEGYGSLQTKGYEGRDSVVFVPLTPFRKYFLDDPVGLSVRLQAAAKELRRRWLEKNAGLPGEQRKAVGWSDLIFRYEWKDSNGKRQITVWELSINTYGMTRNHLLEDNPDVSEEEFKVLVKTRSTVNADSRPDKTLIDAEGMGPTPGGYNKEFYVSTARGWVVYCSRRRPVFSTSSGFSGPASSGCWPPRPWSRRPRSARSTGRTGP